MKVSSLAEAGIEIPFGSHVVLAWDYYQRQFLCLGHVHSPREVGGERKMLLPSSSKITLSRASATCGQQWQT